MIENNLILRDVIEEKTNKLNYLIKSQQELKYLLLLDSSDNEISSAFYENNEIIERIKKEIKELQIKLQEIDPAYIIEITNEIQSQNNEEKKERNNLESSMNGVYL